MAIYDNFKNLLTNISSELGICKNCIYDVNNNTKCNCANPWRCMTFIVNIINTYLINHEKTIEDLTLIDYKNFLETLLYENFLFYLFDIEKRNYKILSIQKAFDYILNKNDNYEILFGNTKNMVNIHEITFNHIKKMYKDDNELYMYCIFYYALVNFKFKVLNVKSAKI